MNNCSGLLSLNRNNFVQHTLYEVIRDLLFVEHNAFIAQFNDNKPEQLFIHFNIDCEEEEAKNLLRNMEYKANELGMIVIRGKKYTLEQKDDAEEMELKFFD